MENIPVEILEHIFHYIGTYELCEIVSKVCKKWNLIVMRHAMNIKDANELEMFHESLRAVIVSDPVCNLYQASKLISCATQMIPRLQELTIGYYFPLDKEDFKSLMCFPHLKHLDVFSKRKWMCKNTPINPNVTSIVVNEAMENDFLKNLREYNKLSAFHMYGRAQFYIDIKMVKFLQVHAVTLQDLTLRCQEFTDERFKVISQCVGLVSLRLYKCCLLTPRSIESIASLSKLRCLHLTGARLFRSLGILELINSLPLLIEDLNLSYSDFGNEHCTALAHRLPRLAALELWRCGPALRGRMWQGGAPELGRGLGLGVGMGTVRGAWLGDSVGLGVDPGLGGDMWLARGSGLGRGPWPREGGGPGLGRGPWPGEGGGPGLGRGPWLSEGGCTGLGQALPRLAQQLRSLRALDTDAVLTARQLRQLAQHPALRKLRCLWNGPTHLVRSKLIITSALKEYPRKYLRDESEGPSAELFYYWTREIDLQLLKKT